MQHLFRNHISESIENSYGKSFVNIILHRIVNVWIAKDDQVFYLIFPIILEKDLAFF